MDDPRLAMYERLLEQVHTHAVRSIGEAAWNAIVQKIQTMSGEELEAWLEELEEEEE